MDELNPNHPVTAAAHDHWHKIVGLLMEKFGVSEVLITQDDLDAFVANHPDCVVMLHDKREGMFLKIITAEEGARLAREQGGLLA